MPEISGESSQYKVVVRGELGDAPPRFEAAALEVHGHGPDEPTMQKLIEIAERSCSEIA
mgnify:CR=1 FL=1